MNKKFSPHQLLAGVLGALVLVVVIVGINMAGSPATARREQFDMQRVNALDAIANGVDQVYSTDGKLPASLEELSARAQTKRDVYLNGITDPVTSAPYEYRPMDAGKYELCATFEALTPEGRDGRGNIKQPSADVQISYPGYQTWDHGIGRTCFTLDAQVRGPVTNCSVTMPCANPNHTCMATPNRGAICVAQGHECEAAGCAPGACTLAESYPVQVSCINDPNMVIPPAHPEPLPGSPEDPLPNEGSPVSCNLMRSTVSGEMACFGCGSKACSKPGPEWEHYTRADGEMGIPYSCYDDERGWCALAQ